MIPPRELVGAMGFALALGLVGGSLVVGLSTPVVLLLWAWGVV